MSSPFVDGNGRPVEVYSKQRIEEVSKYLQSYVGSAMPGPNPYDEFEMQLAQTTGREHNFFGGFTTAYDHGYKDPEEHATGEQLGLSGITAAFNDRFSKRNPVASLNVPHDTVGLMTVSMKYAEDNYIVNRGIKVKKNFALKGFTLLGSATTKDHYTEELRRLRFRYWLGKAYWYYWSCGRVVIYWGEKRPIPALSMLDPRLVVVRRFLGVPSVFLKPDRRWREMLQNKDSIEGKWLRKQLPSWWIPYIMKDQEIPLKPETYALIENDLSLFSARGISAVGGVPLQPCFTALQTLNMHMAGDFSTAWMMKNLIALVSIGDPKIEGDKYTRADQNELAKLQTAFQRPEYAMWAYVDPTVQIRWAHPDPELFATVKYEKPTEVIEYTVGIPPVFSPSAGKMDFNAATMSLKPFREEVTCGRQDMEEQFLAQLFPQLREGHARRKAGTKDPQWEWDNDSLKDDAQIMDELTARFDRGALSIQSLLDGVSQDIDTERERKKAEQPEAELWRPLWDMSHGIDAGDAGRPNTTGQKNTETSNPSPRPSRP